MSERFVMVTKDGCPFCSLLKMEMTKRGHAFEQIDATDDERRLVFYKAAGVRTVPQLFRTSEDFSLEAPTGDRLGGWTEISSDWNALA